MANTDWLTTLLSGVSGAFTGYGQANERRASAAELARQIARQTEMDAITRQRQGIDDEMKLTEMGYVRGDIPKQFSGASMALPGMGAFDAGSAMDALRVGPSRTASDGTKFTLDRTRTPQAREANAARAVLEARQQAQLDAQRDKVDGAWEFDSARGVRVNKRTGVVQPLQGLPPRPVEPKAPRSRTVQVDGRTGIRYSVDLSDPNDKPIPILMPDGNPMRDVPESVRKEVAATYSLDSSLDNFAKVAKEVGNSASITPGVAQQRLMTAMNGVMNDFRVVNGLGVINGPDLQIINDAIGDITSIGARIRGRGTVAQIEAAVKEMKDIVAASRRIREQAFGLQPMNPPAPVAPPNSPDAIADDLVRAALSARPPR